MRISLRGITIEDKRLEIIELVQIGAILNPTEKILSLKKLNSKKNKKQYGYWYRHPLVGAGEGGGGLLEKKLELTQKFGSGSTASSTSRGYRTLTVCLLSNLER